VQCLKGKHQGKQHDEKQHISHGAIAQSRQPQSPSLPLKCGMMHAALSVVAPALTMSTCSVKSTESAGCNVVLQQVAHLKTSMMDDVQDFHTSLSHLRMSTWTHSLPTLSRTLVWVFEKSPLATNYILKIPKYIIGMHRLWLRQPDQDATTQIW